jgi:hypothetical protein
MLVAVGNESCCNLLYLQATHCRLEQAINALGIESARDQQLGAAITSIAKLRGTNHRVYLLSKQQSDGARQIVGLLKTGAKKLFLTVLCAMTCH